MAVELCAFPSCEFRSEKRGWCETHYRQCWDRANLQGLCRRCHLLKSQSEYRARWAS